MEIAGAELLAGDGPRSLKEARGKVVVLDFWATWCGPCKLSFPFLAQIADDFRSDVVVFGVSVDAEATKEQILTFAAEGHAKFPILWDRDGSTAAVYDGNKLPSTFVLDWTGAVRHYHNGFGKAHAATIRREIRNSSPRSRRRPRWILSPPSRRRPSSARTCARPTTRAFPARWLAARTTPAGASCDVSWLAGLAFRLVLRRGAGVQRVGVPAQLVDPHPGCDLPPATSRRAAWAMPTPPPDAGPRTRSLGPRRRASRPTAQRSAHRRKVRSHEASSGCFLGAGSMQRRQ